MTKPEFIDAVARRTGMSETDAANAVDAILEILTDTLGRGDSVTFTGYGRFTRSTLTERLSKAASDLRSDAEQLERTHERFADRIESSRRTLREIAETA